jgi:hypothetical protein
MMRCLTYTDAQIWLNELGMRVSQAGDLEFSSVDKRPSQTAQYKLVSDRSNLWRVSELLANWFEHSQDRLLWLKYWETYPPGQLTLLEKARLGCGQDAEVSRAPWHLFAPAVYVDFDARPPEAITEEGLLVAIIAQVIAFKWDAILFGEGRCEYLSISDGYGLFASKDASRLEAAKELLGPRQS